MKKLICMMCVLIFGGACNQNADEEVKTMDKEPNETTAPIEEAMPPSNLAALHNPYFPDDNDSEEDLPFCEAIWEGKAETVKRLIAKGANVNEQSCAGGTRFLLGGGTTYTLFLEDQPAAQKNNTPLIHAAIVGHAGIVKLLLAAGAQVNTQGYRDETALMAAAADGNVEIVKLLLNAKADTNLKNYEGETALVKAARHRKIHDSLNYKEDAKKEGTFDNESLKKDYVEIVRLLLAAGANVNEKTTDDTTALMQAADETNVEMVKALLDAGADPKARDKDGLSALAKACQHGSVEIANMLVAAGAEDSLPSAALRGDVQAVKAFIKKGSDVNQRYENQDGDTALIFASSGGHAEVLKVLLAAGADVNLTDKKGATPLMCARKGEIVSLLLTAGAKIHVKHPDGGDTALIFASCNGRTDAAELLLKAQANVNEPASNGISPLMCAAWNGHPETVKLLLKNKANINQVDEDGRTALMLAVQNEQAEVVKVLVQASADMTKQDDDALTALMLAVKGSGFEWERKKMNPEIVKILLAAGANPNDKGRGNENAISYAIAKKDAETTKLLLDAGADPNTRFEIHPSEYYNGSPILVRAVGEGQTEIVRLLLKAGAKINDARDYHGRPPLTRAIEQGYTEIAKLLIAAGANANTKELLYNNDTSLIEACHTGNAELVKALLETGADVNLANARGYTPLMNAAMLPDTTIAKMLLKAGANVHASNDVGQTAFILAETPEMLKLLMNAGADINASTVRGNNDFIELSYKDVNDYTKLSYSARDGKIDIVKLLIAAKADVNKGEPSALMLAAQEGHAEIAKLLIAAGANVHAQDEYGSTALLYAVEEITGSRADNSFSGDTSLENEVIKGKTEIVKMLLAAGADPKVRDKDGLSALAKACQYGLVEIANMLVAAGAEDSLPSAALRGDVKAVKEFIQKGANVNDKDKDGFTVLMSAVSKNYPEVTKLLLDAGADINAVSGEGIFGGKHTALALAVANGQTENVKLLLTKGADVNAVDLRRNTPIIFAAGHGHTEIVKLLIEAGAKVNVQGESDETPLMLAARAENVEIVKILLEAGADVNVENERGRTAISFAGQNEEIKKLLQAYKKDTLWDACSRLDVEAAQAFINAGADVNVLHKYTIMVGGVNWDGYQIRSYSVLHHMLVQKYGNKSDEVKRQKIIKLLKAAGAKDIDTP